APVPGGGPARAGAARAAGARPGRAGRRRGARAGGCPAGRRRDRRPRHDRLMRVALVTGAAGGIGRAVALALARDGRAVAVGDLDLDGARGVAGELEADGARAVAVRLDVTDRDSVAGAVTNVAGELGAIDVLVNSAGWDELRPFVDTDEDLWRRVVEINYLGCVRVTHAALPGMLERGYGRIVNVASDAGRVGSSREAVYAGAKGGVIAFTKTIAREAARAGVTANAVCPGPTATPLPREL